MENQKEIRQLSLFPFPKVIKRSGEIVEFQSGTIYSAMQKAFKSTYEVVDDGMTQKLQVSLEEIIIKIQKLDKTEVTIHEIQLIVEETLKLHDENAGNKYTKYREDHDKLREEKQKAQDINFTIGNLVNKKSTTVNENANKDSNVFNTQRDLTAGIVGKSIGLKMLPFNVADAHQVGDIHYHDLDYHPYSPMTNCCLIDFGGMLNKGFRIGNADVESPKSIQTATAQISQIIANVASSQYGGCTVDRIDEVLAPFAERNYGKNLADAYELTDDEEKAKSFARKKTRKDIYDAMQSLEYEINTLFTSNGQTPFTSVGFGLGTNWFEREIQRAILLNRIKGLGKEGRTAIFPKLIFTIKKGLNFAEGDPNYDIKQLALECAAKRMYPDIVNYDKIVELTGSFKAPMGCRSFLQGWKDENGKEVNAGRMNLGVVTMNLPRLALKSAGDKDKFWNHLKLLLDVVKEALLYRIKRCKEAVPENAPILYQYGAFGKRLKPGEDVDKLFRNKRATISMGYIGLYEVATAFYGGEWETNPEAKEFTLEIMRKLKAKADEWGNEYGYHFSVYSTPSESLTDRFSRLDREKFGVVENITDKEYYTNSFHYDVRKNPTPFEKLDFEKDYPKYCSGGFIHYCEYPVLQQNPKALEAVWDYSYGKVGYLGTNTPIDKCYECGYEGDFNPTERGFECPSCGNHNPKTCDVVKRTCGYLGNPQARPMVHGRHKEISARVKHM
jgi:ribonucleoside-triphosphate reductase